MIVLNKFLFLGRNDCWPVLRSGGLLLGVVSECIVLIQAVIL